MKLLSMPGTADSNLAIRAGVGRSGLGNGSYSFQCELSDMALDAFFAHLPRARVEISIRGNEIL